MKKLAATKLTLHTETLRSLSPSVLDQIAGGILPRQGQGEVGKPISPNLVDTARCIITCFCTTQTFVRDNKPA